MFTRMEMKSLNLKLKNFIKIFVCLILCIFAFCLSACGKDSNDNYVYPTSSDETFGNGGLAVQKGDYIYFVNGYQSSEDMESQNASYTLGALMIAKLDSNGNLILNEDDLLDDEYYRTMSDKLCGFEATGLYIFGDYLYFTSPCQENESGDEVWAKNRVDFYRIRLNKSGDVERLYQTEVEHSNLEYEYYYNNLNVYLLVYEKETNLDHSDISNRLLRIDANSKDVTTVATDVGSVVMPSLSNEYISNSYEKIFYVEQDSDDNSYSLKQYNIVSNASSSYMTSSTAITATFVTNNYVYITDNANSRNIMMRSNFIDESGFERSGPIDTSLYSSLNMTPEGNCIVAVTDNTIEFFINGDTSPAIRTVVDEDEEVTDLNIIGFANGNIFYYDNNNAIKMVSYANLIAGSESEIKTLATITDLSEEYYFDLDNEYLYFYKTVGSNNYLHRLIVNNNYGETEEMLGVYLEDDIPEPEEEDANQEETEETA